ncbi:MAG: rod shape-determining protein MreC [Treponema sp.]|jgi:rod shape-determining protein MreC|nr:rod shape-determining protein MreC [Treponema sp.]
MIREEKNKKRRTNTALYIFIILCLISSAMLFLSARNIAATVKESGLTMYSGLRASIYRLKSFVSGTVLSIQELAILKDQYDELANRISRYEQLEKTAAGIRQENNRLREQLDFSQDISYRHIAAEIIGNDPDNLFSALVINKGKKDGITVNMPVIAYQKNEKTRSSDMAPTGTVLVGKVVRTAQFESLIMPLYDSASYISSRLGESRIEGIVEGQGSADIPLLLRFVRRQTRGEISIGEQVITSGLGGVFPSGILLGRVSRVLYQDTDTSIEIELESSADFSRLEYVFVIDTHASIQQLSALKENRAGL